MSCKCDQESPQYCNVEQAEPWLIEHCRVAHPDELEAIRQRILHGTIPWMRDGVLVAPDSARH